MFRTFIVPVYKTKTYILCSILFFSKNGKKIKEKIVPGTKAYCAKLKVFKKLIGHQAVEIKIIQNRNKTNSDLCLRNMSIERNHNSEISSL
jgi:hypothetical protein